MWQGCNFSAWMRMLMRNRFRVGWRQSYVAAIATGITLGHTALRVAQHFVYGKRIRHTVLQPPIFILGHWRTGTTLLHELLVLDPRHSFPTSYECFAPNHFLLSEKLMTKCLWFLSPNRRPMDNMAAGWDRPQEDEFAMCMLGQPSPYLTIAFPNHGPVFDDYLDLEELTPRELKNWRHTFKRFLQAVAVRNPRRLVLKSPPHTWRIRVLKEMFPDAHFIHIVRNPYVVYPSTMNLWRSLFCQQALQKPSCDWLERHVLETFVNMHERLRQTRHLVADDHFFELRYEDLVRDPLSQLRALYEHLHLGGFDEARPQLEAYLAGVSGYETNRYQLTPREHSMITRHWGHIITRYGYADQPLAAVA
jgi:hypothetical protein